MSNRFVPILIVVGLIGRALLGSTLRSHEPAAKTATVAPKPQMTPEQLSQQTYDLLTPKEREAIKKIQEKEKEQKRIDYAKTMEEVHEAGFLASISASNDLSILPVTMTGRLAVCRALKVRSHSFAELLNPRALVAPKVIKRAATGPVPPVAPGTGAAPR